MIRNPFIYALIFVTSILLSSRFASTTVAGFTKSHRNQMTVYSVQNPRDYNTSRIVGGEFTTAEKFPFVVQIRYDRVDGIQYCTGSIIAKRKILTAAHCQVRTRDVIVYGRTKLNEGGTAVSINNVTNHPKYNDKNYENDIAVITLKEDVIYGTTARAVTVAKETPAEGAYAYVSGWGRTMGGNTADTMPPPQLKQVVVKIYYGNTCKGRLPDSSKSKFFDKTNLCTFRAKGQGTCVGDSGGPVTSGEQVGVVSFGIPCAEGYPDVHTKVSAYYDWIKSQIIQ